MKDGIIYEAWIAFPFSAGFCSVGIAVLGGLVGLQWPVPWDGAATSKHSPGTLCPSWYIGENNPTGIYTEPRLLSQVAAALAQRGALTFK